MMNGESQSLLPAQERQCERRLENDAGKLEALSSGRMRVHVKRFGKRVSEIQVLFPRVRTAFFRLATEEVEVREAEVLTRIRPNAGSAFPYPLGPPEVRMYYPNLAEGEVPWLGGLVWLDGRTGLKELEDLLTGSIRDLVACLWASADGPVGIPCLWRDGEWNPDLDLVFVAGQIHRLLTDPRDYSRTDSMNPEAAEYWAGHKDRLPLEPPLAEMSYGVAREGVAAPQDDACRFTLVEVK
jgi:hypothetical protein